MMHKPAPPEKSPLAAWLQSEAIVQLVRRYNDALKNREVDMGFNLFHLISDVYHRENLHSDMMEAILSPTGGHDQDTLFLQKFLEFLQTHLGVDLQLDDYRTAKVVREDSRIDLLIYDETSRRAIIIENKINGAPDMHRQLVCYLEKVTSKTPEWGYKCDAIIYLCLNNKVHPNQRGWQEEEKNKVNHLLRVISAYDESPGDLYTGWLAPCIEVLRSKVDVIRSTKTEQVEQVLRQYQQLILKLGRTQMSKPVMEDFYQMLKNPQCRESAEVITKMMDGLPKYRCQRVLDEFRENKNPFDHLAPYGAAGTLAIFEGLDGKNIKLHVDCGSPNCTVLSFWHNSDDDPQGGLPRRILDEIGMTGLFSFELGWFTKRFQFPSEEEEMYKFICFFKKELLKRPSSN